MPVHDHGDRPYAWVGALSEKRATLTPGRVGLIDADTGVEYTYADLDRRANQTARLLRELGVERGDRVAVVSRNRPELVDCYFATAKLGAILAPLSHRLAARELTALLADAEPAALLVEEPFVAAVEEALDHDRDRATERERPALLSLPALEDGTRVESAPDVPWQPYGERLPDDASPLAHEAISLADPHLFLHTGGSTGLPKLVVQSHGAIAWNALNTITSWGLRPDDVTPMCFPFFHTGGWNVLTVPFFHLGATVVISREVAPGDLLAQIERHAGTVLVAVPAVLRFVAEHDAWERTDLSSLRFVKSGGGPCRESVIDAWADRAVDVSQGYGLTECGPNNFATPAGWEKPESIGVPGLYVDARVVDDEGRELPRGEIGELELASPHAGDRYWRNEEATAETFETADDGGSDDQRGLPWVSTGDLARVDSEGHYHIEGRKKTMFVSGGENVYPPEVENAIAAHPKVDEAVVVPVPDDRWGEVGKAVVEGDDSLTLAELETFLDGRLARFKRPRELAFVESMPTSGPSKIDRQAVEDAFGSRE